MNFFSIILFGLTLFPQVLFADIPPDPVSGFVKSLKIANSPCPGEEIWCEVSIPEHVNTCELYEKSPDYFFWSSSGGASFRTEIYCPIAFRENTNVIVGVFIGGIIACCAFLVVVARKRRKQKLKHT